VGWIKARQEGKDDAAKTENINNSSNNKGDDVVAFIVQYVAYDNEVLFLGLILPKLS
jgi:hypothetical protein